MHPGVGNKKGTLANYVRYYLESKGEYDNLVDRAGIVHRLDKGVSGLVVVGKNKKAQEFLKREFKNRRVIKVYHAELEEYTNIEQKFDLKEYVEEMNIKMKPWKEWEKVEGYIGRSKIDRYKMEFKGYEFPGSKYALSYILLVEMRRL
jgi:23S rRNA-/tRNA-specific pseudouridylate synthase